MNKENGIYVLLVDFPELTSPNKACIPLQYCNGEAYVLSIEKIYCNSWKINPIRDFAIISEEKLFDKVIAIDPSYSLYPIKNRRNYRLKRIKTDLGENYSSIYRPVISEQLIKDLCDFQQNDIPSTDSYNDLPISNRQEYSNLIRQLEIILDDLENIFKVIAPNKHNKGTYGHAIRNIILLACTEIDMMMKHILERNDYSRKNTYSTNDYIHLLKPLRLNEYQVGFQRFGNSLYSPFWRWSSENPSQSIWWYDAYNKIKHDREKYFKQANIGTAINAVMAFAITLIAQYGYRNDIWNEHVGKIIRVMKEPQWELEDFYFFCPDLNKNILYSFEKNTLKKESP